MVGKSGRYCYNQFTKCFPNNSYKKKRWNFYINCTISNACGNPTYSISKSSIVSGKPIPTIQQPVYFGNEVSLTALYIPGATYNWYEAGILAESGSDNHYTTTVECNTSKLIQAEAVNICGTSTKAGKGVSVSCDEGQFTVTPNPAVNIVNVLAKADNKKIVESYIREMKIYDLNGQLKLQKKFNNQKTATLDIATLYNGVYFIEITSDSYRERKQLIIQK